MRTHIESSRLAVQKISLHRLYEARERARTHPLPPNPEAGGIPVNLLGA